MNKFLNQLERALKTAQHKSKPFAVHALALAILVGGWMGYSLIDNTNAQILPPGSGIKFSIPADSTWTVGQDVKITWTMPETVITPANLALTVNRSFGEDTDNWSQVSYLTDPVFLNIKDSSLGSFDWKVGYRQDANGVWSPMVLEGSGWTYDNSSFAIGGLVVRGDTRYSVEYSVPITIQPGLKIKSIFPHYSIYSKYPEKQQATIITQRMDLLPLNTLGDFGHFYVGVEARDPDTTQKFYKTIGKAQRATGPSEWLGKEPGDERWILTILANTDLDTILGLHYRFFVSNDKNINGTTIPDSANVIFSTGLGGNALNLGTADDINIKEAVLITEPTLGDTWRVGEVRNIKWLVPEFSGETATASFVMTYKTSVKYIGRSQRVTRADIGSVQSFEYRVGQEGKHTATPAGLPMTNTRIKMTVFDSDLNSRTSFSETFNIENALYAIDVLTPTTSNEEWEFGKEKAIEFKIAPRDISVLPQTFGVDNILNFSLAQYISPNVPEVILVVENNFRISGDELTNQTFSFVWEEVGFSPNGSSLPEEKFGEDVMIMGKVGPRVNIGWETVGKEFKIVEPIPVPPIVVTTPTDVFWGDNELISFNTTGIVDTTLKVVLVGGGDMPDEYVLDANYVIDADGSHEIPWYVDRRPESGYCWFGRNGSPSLIKFIDNSTGEVIQSTEDFAIKTPFTFNQPPEGTCTVGLIFPDVVLEYPSGTILNGRVFKDSDFLMTGTTNTAVFMRTPTGSEAGPWELLINDADLTFNNEGFDFAWDIPATEVEYSAQLMFVYSNEGEIVLDNPFDPTNIDYFTHSLSFVITPAGGEFDIGGVYISSMVDFNFTNPLSPPPLETLGTFTALDDPATGSITYAVSFYDEDGEILGETANPLFLGWFNAQSDLTILKADAWFGEVRSAKFKATLNSYSWATTKPKVYSMSLGYTVNPENEIATINFVDSSASRTITKGEFITMPMRVNLKTNFVGPRTMDINVDITGTDTTDITWSSDPLTSVFIEADATEALFDLIISTSALTAVGAYDLTVSGTFAGGQGLIAVPLITDFGVVDVIVPGEFDIAHELLIDTKSVAPGEIANYTINITRDPDFIDPITFSIDEDISDPITDWATFLPNPATINVGLTNLSVVVPDTELAPQTLTFFIKATSGDISRSIEATLKIIDPDSVRTLNLTIPIEEGAIRKTNTPAFVLRIYEGFQRIFESNAFFIDENSEATVDVPTNLLESGTEYTPLTRSTRHLWAEGTKFTPDGSASYDIGFPKLLAGDIYRDDDPDSDSFTSTINTLDLGMVLGKYGQSGNNMLEDLDNNDYINTLDLGFIIKNIFQSFIWNM